MGSWIIFVAQRTGILLLFLFLVISASSADAQGQFAGVYFGTFSGFNNSGQFGILVRNNGVAIVSAYDSIDNDGFISENVTINPNGTFALTNIDGAGSSISGAFTATNVSGQFVASDGFSGTFSGNRISFIIATIWGPCD